MTGTQTLYSRLSELPLDAATLWLSAEETAVWTEIRSTGRKATWLAGRIVAKRLLLRLLAEQPHRLANSQASAIHIESRSRTGRGDRPVVSIGGQRVPVALSIAHTKLGALAAATLRTDVALGVDLVTPTDAGQSLDWTFTDAELMWLAASTNHTHSAARIWALKEAIYKACQRGEGFAPRDIEVAPGQRPRYPDFDAAHDLVHLQSWRIDGHFAALAIMKNSAAGNSANDRNVALAGAA